MLIPISLIDKQVPKPGKQKSPFNLNLTVLLMDPVSAHTFSFKER